MYKRQLRAQADKADYSREMRQTLENTENLTIKQAEIVDIIVEEGSITGVKTVSYTHLVRRLNINSQSDFES